MSSGTWTTTKGGGLGITITTGGVVALIVAGYALTHPKQATAAVSGAATIAAITVVTVVVLGIAAFVFLRLRGRSRNTVEARDGQALPPGIRWQRNPNALPPREHPAIPAAPAPVTVINNFGGLASELAAEVAGLLYERQQQPAPVYVQSETVKQQEIRP